MWIDIDLDYARKIDEILKMMLRVNDRMPFDDIQDQLSEVTQLNAIPSICAGATWNVTTTTACTTARLECRSTGSTPSQTITTM